MPPEIIFGQMSLFFIKIIDLMVQVSTPDNLFDACNPTQPSFASIIF